MNIPKKLDKYLTKRAKNAIAASFKISAQYPDKGEVGKVTASHLVYALAHEKGSIAGNILAANDVKQAHLLKKLKNNSQNTEKNKTPNALGASYKKSLKKAASYAMDQDHYFIGTEHLLYGAISRSKSVSPAKARKIKEHLDSLMAGYLSMDSQLLNATKGNTNSGTAKDEALFEDNVLKEALMGDAKTLSRSSKMPALDAFSENISRKARNNELEPLVGREQELNRLIRILSRKNKNNPLLVGDAGVGKTALVEGLAQKIAEGNVPQTIIDKQIYALDLSSLIAGTLYRGEFEERIKDIMDEAQDNDVILFIDEIHILPGAGAAQGSLDAANILKPALANGAFQCIGATTFEEYKKTIEKDPALERRFQKIFLQEPSAGEAIKTLQRLKPFYEQHHNVKIAKNIAKLCVDLSIKHIPSRALPDKALDIMDEAASFSRARTMPKKDIKKLKIFKNKLKELAEEKNEALKKEHYQKAMQIKNRQEIIKGKIEKLGNTDTNEVMPNVSRKDVYEVVSEISGVPLSQLTKSESEVLAELENKIENFVIGQKDAVKKTAQIIRRSRAGVRSHERPMGSLLFMGPSGTGKTELARIISHIMAETDPKTSKDPVSFIKLDMSEYSEPHTIARLIGAPPGYIGYEEAGLLTDKVRKNPYSVVLFDEIEKAHPKIFNILLQILENGSLTDAQGREANFKNTFVILTSNVGAEFFSNVKSMGYEDMSSRNSETSALKNLKDIMKVEIINRLDDIVIFKTLSENSLKKIANLHLDRLNKRMQGVVKLEFTPGVSSYIVSKADTKQKGARGIRKATETEIEERLAEHILSGKNKNIKISTKGSKLILKEQK
ncbi:MAG: ATP-dependent Clp protease ATP-binding subunit [Candidatus Spechtbacterales bacterium]|nr:ATP-dependent Clp protease ATP-binding subunit [Candidatus Spechtbacterales bacterium]